MQSAEVNHAWTMEAEPKRSIVHVTLYTYKPGEIQDHRSVWLWTTKVVNKQ
jgi:hypothetical protein